jgi:hypothetical protein
MKRPRLLATVLGAVNGDCSTTAEPHGITERSTDSKSARTASGRRPDWRRIRRRSESADRASLADLPAWDLSAVPATTKQKSFIRQALQARMFVPKTWRNDRTPSRHRVAVRSR